MTRTGLRILQITPGRRLHHCAHLVDGDDKGRRAAVADWSLGTVKLDDHIVDAETADRGQHMFGGANQRAGSVAEHGLEFGGSYGMHIGTDFTLVTALPAGADEDDSGIRIGGMQRERNGKAGMNANAADGNLIAESDLPTSLHSSVPALGPVLGLPHPWP